MPTRLVFLEEELEVNCETHPFSLVDTASHSREFLELLDIPIDHHVVG